MEHETDNPHAVWVDSCLARLTPPREWRPDSESALQKFLKQQQGDRKASWIRVSSTAAIVVGMFAVLALLPWHLIWNAAIGKQNSNIERSKAAVPALTPPLPPMTSSPAPLPPAAPAAVQRPARATQSETKGEDEKPVEAATPPAPVAVQQPTVPNPGEQDKPPEPAGNGATAPVVVSRTEPSYTDEARRQHIQGTVTLDVAIDAEGNPKVVRVAQGLGYGLDENAKAAVEQWKFKPGTFNGKPVAVAVKIAISFYLN
jgi:TonB family protein